MGYKKPIVLILILSLLFIILQRNGLELHCQVQVAPDVFRMQGPHLFTMGETFPWLLLLPLFITVYFIVQQVLQKMPILLSIIGEHSTKPSPGVSKLREQNGSEIPGNLAKHIQLLEHQEGQNAAG